MIKTEHYFCLSGTVVSNSPSEYLEDGSYTYFIIVMMDQQFVDEKGNLRERKCEIPVRLFDALAEKYERFIDLNTKVIVEGFIEGIYDESPVYTKQISANEYILSKSAPENGTHFKGSVIQFKGLRLVASAIKIL